MALYALLVGINEYQGEVADLAGCHYDVQQFAELLQYRFAAKTDNIQILLSEQATRDHIIAGFEQHLTQAGEGDTALFYYSGHGSQATTADELLAIEADGLDETLVCHDSRLDGHYDLADDELRYLIAQVSEKNPHISIILDCCHAGGGTRQQVTVRLTETDLRQRPLESYCFYHTLSLDNSDDKESHHVIEHLAEGAHVLLSACRESELAKEIAINGQAQGVFSYYLRSIINQQQSPLSYHDLMTRTSARVHNKVHDQHPQLEAIAGAKVNEGFLQGALLATTLLVYWQDKQWWLSAGGVHGLSVGDQLEFALLNNESENKRVHHVVLTRIEPNRSLLALQTESHAILDALLDPEQQYKAQITQQNNRPVILHISGDEYGVTLLRQQLQQYYSDHQNAVRFVENTDTADYYLLAQQQTYTIYHADKQHQLFKTIEYYDEFDESNARRVLQQLAHRVRWQQKLYLENLYTTLPLDAVSLVTEYEGVQAIDTHLSLHYKYDNTYSSPPQQPCFKLKIRLHPAITRPLYCVLFYFDSSDGYIGTELLSGVWLMPNDITEAHAFDGRFIPTSIPEHLRQQGINQTSDFVKLIVSESELDASLIQQQGLEAYQTNISVDPAHHATTRGMMVRKKKQRYADWMTKTIMLTTIYPSNKQEKQA